MGKKQTTIRVNKQFVKRIKPLAKAQNISIAEYLENQLFNLKLNL